MVINVSHFPSWTWKKEELSEAEKRFGEIVDIQFPRHIDESLDSDDLKKIAEKLMKDIERASGGREFSCLVSGEKGVEFHLIKMLKEKGIPVFYVMKKIGKKFRFAGFRQI